MSEQDSSQQQNSPNMDRQKHHEDIERQVLHDLAFEAIKEQRKQRRWRLLSRILGVLVIAALISWSMAPPGGYMQTFHEHVAKVNVDGMIAESYPANADDIINSLESAFKNDKAKGVLLQINSPGGSVVQSSYIYQAIKRLKSEHPDKKVDAVCSDVCASGGYYIAAAADKIYADRSSIVGSIGVISGGFGFVDTLNKLGMTRRLFTSGDRKDFMDPFSKLRDNDVHHLNQMLNNVHQQFIQVVKESRGHQLAKNDQLFSGLAWTGERAKTLGLVDSFATPQEVAIQDFDNDQIVDYTQSSLGPFGSFQSLANEFSHALVHALYNPGFQYRMPSN